MPNPGLDDDVLIEAVRIRAQHETTSEAARAAGIIRCTFRHRLRLAAARGLDGSVPEPIPLGQVVKGTSTLYKIDPVTGAEQVMQWVKTKEDPNFAALHDALTEAFSAYKGHSILPPPPVDYDRDLLNFFPRPDFHIGLYAWAEETLGDDFDLSIGERVLRETTERLFSSAPRAETALIIGLGDLTHADNDTNTTPASGNRLDVDTRYPKVLRVAISVEIGGVEMALQTHSRVIWRLMPGNHDPHTAVAVACAVAMFFANNPRVEIDLSPSMFFYHRFGENLIGATHGHTVKQKDLPILMANHRPEDWVCKFKSYHTGHIHHLVTQEVGGVVCESHRSPAAKDAWHAEHGYIAGRSMTSITLHRDQGEQSRRTVNILR